MSTTKLSLDDLLPAITETLVVAETPDAEQEALSSVLQSLRAELASRVEAMLIHRRELLLSLLYRIDVKESLVVDAFRSAPHGEIATRLADLIIDRQLEKVRSRRAYGNTKR